MNSISNIKIIVVGECLSGKTCLINRYLTDSFEPSPLNFYGVDFKILKYKYGPIEYKIQIWDTAGLEKYKSITKSYFHSATGIVLLVDVTDPYGLVKLETWIHTIEESFSKDSECKIILALTKMDLDKEIDMDFVYVVAERYDLKFFEVSSKNGENVKEMFEYLIKESIVLKNKQFLSNRTENFRKTNSRKTNSIKNSTLESTAPHSFSESIVLSNINTQKEEKIETKRCSC